MSHGVQLQHLESLPIAVVRRQVRRFELSRVVPECCGLVWNVARAQQARAGRHVAVYLDDVIHIEVGVELLGPFVERDGVVRSTTPGGLVASIAHFGPYDGLGAAHRAIQDWCRTQSRRLAGPNWEIYGLWQPEWNHDAGRIRTDVFYQLATG